MRRSRPRSKLNGRAWNAGRSFRDTERIGPVGSEQAGDEVVREHGRVGLRTPPLLASGETPKACSGHEAVDTLAVDWLPEAWGQLRRALWDALGAP